MINNKSYESYWKAKNYINLYYQNYLRYQRNSKSVEERVHITSVERENSIRFDKIVKQELAKIAKDNINVVKHRKKIEDQLNFFFNVRRKQGNKQEQLVWEAIIDKAIEILNSNKKGAKIVATDMTYNNLKVAVNNSAQLQNNEIREKAKDFVVNIYNYQTTIEKIVQAISKNKDDIAKSKYKTEAQIDKLLKIWEIEKKRLETLQPKTGNRGARYFAQSYKNNATTMLSDGNGGQISYRDYAEELQNIYSNCFSSSSYWSGQLAEIVSSIIGYSLQTGVKLTLNNINKVLDKYNVNKGVVGGQSSKKAYDFTKFGDNLLGKQDGEFWNRVLKGTDYDISKSKGVAWSSHASQNKVDITFGIKNSSDIINASVKNYNLSDKSYGKVGLVSGARTLMLIQDQQDFLKHYLNITQKHPNPPLKSEEGGDHLKEFNLNSKYYEPKNNIVQKAHETMKSLLAIKALSGGVLQANLTKKGNLSSGINGSTSNSSQANLFIVNDNSTGRFRVYTISYLLSWIKTNINQLIYEGYPENKTYQYEVDYGNYGENMSGTLRMEDLYRQLHNQKLKISMPAAAFKN